MASRTNPANLGDNGWQLFNRPAFAEFFKASQLRYLEIDIINTSIGVQKNFDFAMSFKPGDGVDDYFSHRTFLPKIEPGRLKR